MIKEYFEMFFGLVMVNAGVTEDQFKETAWTRPGSNAEMGNNGNVVLARPRM